MTKSKILQTLLFCLSLVTTSIALGQLGAISPSNGYLMLYQLNKTQAKYVLCVPFESSKKSKISLVVVGDTFSVETRGALCCTVMSNAYILQTSIRQFPSNDVVQMKFATDAYTLPFSKETKIVFNNSVVELSKLKLGGEPSMTTYEGKAALRKLKEMGLPPDDMDVRKAIRDQKQ